MEIKRKFFSIQKNKYREELLKKTQQLSDFHGLDTSMIFQRLLEFTVNNPTAYQSALEDQETIITEFMTFQKMLLEFMTEIDTRLKNIESKLDNLEVETSKIDDLFEDVK